MMFSVPSETLTFTDPSVAARTDAFGNVIPGRPGGTSPVTCRGVVMPGASQESRDAGRTRDQVVTGYQAYLEGEVPISSSARLVWRGLDLEVVGNPSYHPDPANGRTHHTECALITASG
jgi:hypothetical protein